MAPPSPRAGSSPDHRVGRAATRRHRVLTRAELLELGLSDHGIARRLRSGRLYRTSAGVYAVGAPVDTRLGRIAAGVLGCGSEARASHLTAAELHRLREPQSGVIHVTARSTRARPPSGVVAHRTRRPDPGATVRGGIPCTGIARTLVDIAGTFGRREAERAWRAADARRLLVPAHVAAELRHGLPGCALLREMLDMHLLHGTPRTIEELEERAADLLRPPRLPRPEHNAPVRAGGRRYRADVLWRAERMIVELDSWTWHGTPTQHAEGASRSLDLQVEGWTVVPVTWQGLTVGAEATVLRLSRLLRAAAR